MKRFSICRFVKADLWGECLFTNKSLRLIKELYFREENLGPNFVLRIDKIVPAKLKRPLSNFSLGKIDKLKFSTFYDFTPRQFRHIVSRAKCNQNDIQAHLLKFLESQLHIVLWRTHLFKLQSEVKQFIRAGNVSVNSHNNYAGIQIMPKFRVSKYDFITFKKPNLNHFNRLNTLSLFKLREHHLLINYSTMSIFYLEYPDPLKLFHYFPFEYSNIFFTPRLH